MEVFNNSDFENSLPTRLNSTQILDSTLGSNLKNGSGFQALIIPNLKLSIWSFVSICIAHTPTIALCVYGLIVTLEKSKNVLKNTFEIIILMFLPYFQVCITRTCFQRYFHTLTSHIKITFSPKIKDKIANYTLKWPFWTFRADFWIFKTENHSLMMYSL